MGVYFTYLEYMHIYNIFITKKYKFYTCVFVTQYYIMLEKEMATRTRILAWRIPLEEPGRL